MDIFDDDESKLKYIGHRRGIATCHRLNRRRRKIPHWKNEEMNKKQKFGLNNTVDVEDDDSEIIDGKINERPRNDNKVDVEDDDREIIDGKINERPRTDNRVDVEDDDNEIIDGKINERPRNDNRHFLNHAAVNCASVASMPLCDEPITTDIIIEVNGNITDEEFLNSDKLIPFDFFRFCPVGRTEFKREVRPGWVFHSRPSTTEEILAEIKRWEAEDEANLEEMDKELKLGLNNTVDDVGKVEDNDIEIIDQKINERPRTDNIGFSKYAAVNHASVASMPLCDEPIASQPVFIRSMLSSQTINQILSPIPRLRSTPPIYGYDYVSNIQRSQVVDERARTMMPQRNIQTTIMEPNYWNPAVGPYARNISSPHFQLRPRNPRIPNNNHRS